MGIYKDYLRIVLSFVIVFQIAFLPLAAHPQSNSQVDSEAVSSAEKLEDAERKQKELAESLYQNLLGGNKQNPLDTFSLLRQDFITENGAKVKSISPTSVLLRVMRSQEEVLHEFTARESLHQNYSGKVQGHVEGFQIWMGGNLVHNFRVPVEALAVFGDYLVFLEKGAINTEENFRHISFIDLNYFRLGKSELPIFRVPIQGAEHIVSFDIRDGNLVINGRIFEKGLFDFATGMQRILYNLAVNTTEPEYLSRVINNLTPFVEYFNHNLENAKNEADDELLKRNLEASYKDITSQLETLKKNSETLTEEDLKLVGEKFEKPLLESFEKLRGTQSHQRSLLMSMGNLWQRMTVPRPADPTKLKDKLVTLAVGLGRDTTKADFYELAAALGSSRAVKLSTATLAAAASAYYAPEQVMHMTMQSMEMIKSLGSYLYGYVNLTADTLQATAYGFNPFNFYEVFIADGAWKRTAVGVSAIFTIIAMVMGIPHLIVNTYYLAKDFAKSQNNVKWSDPNLMKDLWRFVRTYQIQSLADVSIRAGEWRQRLSNRSKEIVPNFIRRQQVIHSDYLKALSEEHNNSKPADLPPELNTEELMKQAREVVERMESNQQDIVKLQKFTINHYLWGAVSLFTETHLPFISKTKNKISGTWKRFKGIESFGGAVAHFIFSFASFTKSGIFYATVWNYFYLSRLMAFKPRVAATFLMFPNLFRRSVATELGKVTPTSFWNGGNRWIWQEVAVRFDAITDRDHYRQMKQFENSIISVEKEINKRALAHSLVAVQRYLDYETKSALKFAESKITNKLTTKDVANLSYDVRTFFLSYYDLLVEKSTREYLFHVNNISSKDPLGPNTTREDLKNWFVENKTDIRSGEGEISKIVDLHAADQNIYDLAYERIHNSEKFLSKVGTANKHDTLRNLDPEISGKIRRFILVEQQMKKASAMARAVRANITAIFVDKPMELFLLFVLTAGVKDGPNKPLWAEMFSQDSAFYLSKNVFMGYVAGLIVSIFADVWVKIQMDVRLDGLKGFEQVPTGLDKNRSFRSWYWEQFRHNPKNSWWAHHKEMSSIIYHNLGPAFILMGIIGLSTLGRLDLDFYFVGYIVAFGLPFTGLSTKIEQTFEIASGWVYRDIPEHLRKHPLVIEWANKRITKLRMGFQIYYKLYENILGQFINNLLTLTTVRDGTRTLSRLLFGGKTITEHLIEKTTAGSYYIPGMKLVDKACRLLFTGNYNSGPLPPAPQ